MKFKRFMTMMVAAVAIVVGFSSCSSDDDEDEVAVAEQVAGSYTGQEIISVMGEVSSDVVTNYEFTKATDTTIDMMIPASGEGMMMIPALSVKGLTLAKNGNTITGRAASYAGTVTNASGAEKAYNVTNIAVVFHDKNVAVTFSLKYGSMPMLMETTFTGIKK